MFIFQGGDVEHSAWVVSFQAWLYSMDCFRYLFRSWEGSHQFPRMETTGNQMSSQYVKEKNDEKKNHPSENFIMVFSNAENIAKWNLISCSKNKNGTSGLPPSFCCKKKFKLRVCFGLQFGALRFSPHKDQEQNHARDPEGLQPDFRIMAPKKETPNTGDWWQTSTEKS